MIQRDMDRVSVLRKIFFGAGAAFSLGLMLGLLGTTSLDAAQPQYLSLTNDGLVRTFVLYAPDNLPATPCPLVLMLHGGGGSGAGAMTNMTEYRWNQLADSNQFIVAYPDGVSNRWNDCRADASNQSSADDVGFLSALIDYIGTIHPVDAQRVYAAGHSNGAMMCLCLAMELPDRIAAICVNCGSLAAVSDCSGLSRPVSLLYCMGTDDPLVPFDGGYINVNPPASGSVLPALDTIALWTNAFSIPPVPEATNTFPNIVTTDDSTVTEYDYQRPQSGVELIYLQVNGGGHGWPAPMQFPPGQVLTNGRKNQDINLCDLAWEFFQRHTLDGPPLQVSAARSGSVLQLQWDWGLLQGSSNLINWDGLTANNPTNTSATGLTNQLFSSGAINLVPTNVPTTNSTCFFRLKSP
jgi:polyhydroxybutyrate depolymerase